MGFAFFFFPAVLDNKIKSKTNRKYYGPPNQDIKPFHLVPSYCKSFGVTKYAINIKTPKSKNITNPKNADIFSASIDPIIPAVRTYFAASAKILATTFLLSRFTGLLYHKSLNPFDSHKGLSVKKRRK